MTCRTADRGPRLLQPIGCQIQTISKSCCVLAIPLYIPLWFANSCTRGISVHILLCTPNQSSIHSVETALQDPQPPHIFSLSAIFWLLPNTKFRLNRIYRIKNSNMCVYFSAVFIPTFDRQSTAMPSDREAWLSGISSSTSSKQRMQLENKSSYSNHLDVPMKSGYYKGREDLHPYHVIHYCA